MKLAALAALAAALVVAPGAAATSSVFTVAYTGDHGVWLRSAGGSPHRIRRGEGFGALAASPDGRWLAYDHSGPDGIYVMDTGGTQWWRVSRAGGVPVWSPDGRRIAVASADGVHVAAWNGSGDRRVLRGGDCEAAWAGGDLVATCGRRLLDVSPAGRVRLLDDPRRDGRVAYPSGSTGGTVAFGRRCYEAPFGGDVYCEIATVRLADGARRTLVPYRWGTWGGPEGAPVWIPGSDDVLVSEWGWAHAVVRVDAASPLVTTVRPRAELLLAAAADGSFAVLDGRRVLVCSPQGRVDGRFTLPRSADLDGVAILSL